MDKDPKKLWSHWNKETKQVSKNEGNNCFELFSQGCGNTVKTLYNVTRCNRILNIRHKIAGNGSVSIKIPSFQQNIHLTTPTVTSGNRYTISIEIKLIIIEFLPCVRQICDQNKVFLHGQVSVSLDKWEALCILMQYEIELMYTFGIIAF